MAIRVRLVVLLCILYISLITRKLSSDASIFLREHPWPGRAISDTFDDSTHRTGGASKKCLTALGVICGRAGDLEDDDDYDERLIQGRYSAIPASKGDSIDHNRFVWTPALQQNFREELEKLIILGDLSPSCNN
jgi:phosphatidylinositol 4-kinase type 2